MSVDQRMRNDENEERIFSEKAIIPNADKYIKEIHILEIDKDYKEHTGSIAKYCKVHGIPLFVYSSLKDFKIMRKGELWVGEYNTTYQESFRQLLDIIDAKNLNDLQKDAQDRAIKMANGYWFDVTDYSRVVDADIHNNKSNPLYLKDFERINQIMRKNKLKTLIEFIEYVSSIAKSKWG